MDVFFTLPQAKLATPFDHSVSDVTKRLLCTSPCEDPRPRKFSSEVSRSRNTNCARRTSARPATLDLASPNTLILVSSTTLRSVSTEWISTPSWAAQVPESPEDVGPSRESAAVTRSPGTTPSSGSRQDSRVLSDRQMERTLNHVSLRVEKKRFLSWSMTLLVTQGGAVDYGSNFIAVHHRPSFTRRSPHS